MSSPAESPLREELESCNNYSMLSVTDEEEEEASKTSQLVGNSIAGNFLFVDESARSGELGIIATDSEVLTDYKSYTKQSSGIAEVSSLLVGKDEVLSVECSDSRSTLSSAKQDSNPPTADYSSELQLSLLKSAPVKRQRLPEEDVRGYKKLVLEWEDKYRTSELELGAAREEIVVLKNENQHLKTQVAILQQMGREAEAGTEASNQLDLEHSKLRARNRSKTHK